MREMVGGCCVCSDERGWAENPLVYCDGHGCSVAVHQACYGIVQVPTGPWFCRKCESQERAARVRCELCPHKDGALKRTDSGGWAHVVCALYIPEVQFANVLTMEPIILQYVPHERYIKTCYICEDHGRESKAACGACMTCNRQGCRQAFHVTCAQMAGLLCEEEGPEADNVKYCGYCKHHYSKMQKKMRSSGENTSSSFSHSRGRSTSPSQDKYSSHHHRPRKSHKDKTRQKERHKKSSDSLGSSLTSSVDKLSSGHHGTKDGEGKSKKLSSHGLGHRNKKTGSTGKSCSSSSCSSSPFNTGGGSLTSAQDFLQYSSSSSRLERDHDRGSDGHAAEDRKERLRRTVAEADEEEEEEDEKEVAKDEEEEEEEVEESKYRKPSLQPPALTLVEGSQGHQRSEGENSSFETKVTISTFGSIMRITSSSGLSSGGKIRKISSGDYKPSKSLCKPSHLTTPPILEEADLEEDKATPPPPPPLPPPPPPPRERRHRGNKKSRHGPGRPRGSKNRERREEEHHHHQQPAHAAPLPPPPLAAPSSLYPSPPTLPQAAYPSTLPLSAPTASSSSLSSSRSNILLGSGIYSSHKDPLSLGGGMSLPPLTLGGGVCITPLSSGLLPSHSSTLLPQVNSAPNTQVHPGFSSSYSLSSSQGFGSCMSTAPTLPPLLSQAQTSLPDCDLDDCRYPCQGSSPRESLSSQSPMSCLPLLFDQREGLGHGVRGRLENVPPSSSHIELLLEKHSNEEMGVNIVEMLQSLHSLQQENQRLQDQILSLTAKKERLQLLNVELSVPFPPQAQAHVSASAHVSFLSSGHDHLGTNKSPLSKSCYLNDTSFMTSSEELHSGSPSRSSSSLSFQSTPPLQPSPASFGQPLLNGLARGLSDGLGSVSQAGGSTLPTVSGLMASLAGSPQLNMNGMLGSLNGVIQSPGLNALQPTLPALRPQPPPLNPQGLQLPKNMSPSSLLSEQQKQLLLQQQQQQQLQQFLTSQHFTPEQQVVVYQMLQQQRQREIQHLSPMVAQSPGLLPSATASPRQGGQGGQGNPLFGLQESALHKPGSAGEKGAEKI
ncbi:protein AF-17-like isoform X1 [Hypomesus transpacificus]|uniref:protein AF-17-like isoform X1 n=1 Tax=Hypomesus transpacificus TaxID=137520 RepID=UPI001F07DB5E|nr:protein AF-17-like isoform X1 [Hypomesus transpacificus]